LHQCPSTKANFDASQRASVPQQVQCSRRLAMIATGEQVVGQKPLITVPIFWMADAL
jgi:hypothetical protein